MISIRAVIVRGAGMPNKGADNSAALLVLAES